MAIHRRSQALRNYRRAALALALLAPIVACNAGTKEAPDNKRICGAYAGQLTDGEVIGEGTVRDVLGDRRGPSGEHEGFLLQLDGECDLVLRVETNVDLTGPVPLHTGERVTVKGVYVYNPTGGIVHWTHHDPRGRHEAGYVVAGGKVYQ